MFIMQVENMVAPGNPKGNVYGWVEMGGVACAIVETINTGILECWSVGECKSLGSNEDLHLVPIRTRVGDLPADTIILLQELNTHLNVLDATHAEPESKGVIRIFKRAINAIARG